MLNFYLILIIITVASLAGLLAGLLGIGGGMIIVPGLIYILHQRFGDLVHIQHMAVGTSFAIMIFTSFSNLLAQHHHKAIRWDIFAKMAPGIISGAIIGSLIASHIPSRILQIIFVIFMYTMAVKTILNLQPKAERQIPSTVPTLGISGAMGILSSWLGVGGAAMTVPFMLYCNVTIRQCIGTAAALGWPIALFSALTYIKSGWNVVGLPTGSWGFVYLPALPFFAICTVSFAPLGAKLAHRLPQPILKKAFALLLFVIAIRMTLNLFHV